MQISGTADNVVPMDGSMQYIEEGWGGAPNIYAIMDYWSDLHGCSNQETINFDLITPLMLHSILVVQVIHLLN